MLITLNILWQKKFVRENFGIISAVFLIIYAISRMSMELFREPDAQIGFLFARVTMGQMLTIPMLITGIWIMIWAAKKS